jgi:hypothetical protein
VRGGHILRKQATTYMKQILNGEKKRYGGKFFKSPPKGLTRGFWNFAQNTGPWGWTLLCKCQHV